MSIPPPTRRTRVTLADVAALARVDKSLVSRVINNDQRLVIKDETRQRVLDAIRDLRYRPNAAARSLRTDRSGTLGLLIPDFANPIYAEIIKGAEKAAAERGALLLTGTALEDRPDHYMDMLASGAIEGLILAADTMTPASIAALSATGRPMVAVNQRIPGVQRCILAADERAAAMAVEHLVGLGHRRIGHIRGPAASGTAQRRLNGYRQALRAAGLDDDDELITGTGYAVEHGSEAMRGLLALAHRPTAVVVANIAQAIGALTTARKVGARVPDDVSVVAIHDIPLAANLAPALTTIRMPLAEMGRAGALALLDAESADGGHVVVEEPTELIIRESTVAAAT